MDSIEASGCVSNLLKADNIPGALLWADKSAKGRLRHSQKPCKTLLGVLVLISPLKRGEEAKERNLNLSSPSFKGDKEEALGRAQAPQPSPPSSSVAVGVLLSECG